MFKIAEEHLINSDQVIAKLIDSYRPCTLSTQENHFEVLCNSIISQLISTKAADTISNRFRALYKNSIDPLTILNTPIEELTSIGVSRAKASSIKDLAEKYQTSLKNQKFQQLSDEEIISLLISVKGIGRWTAEIFLIFSLNRLDVLPVADLGIKRAVKVQYQLSEMPSPKKLLEIGQNWRPYRSIASWYLWRSLHNKP